MKNRILEYFISTFLLILSLQSIAQEQDSTKIKQRYGVRFGVDLHRLTKSIYDDNYKGLEFVGDYRISQKFYVAGELGNENKTTDDNNLNFTTKGTYFKVGFDYNTYENWLDMENMIFVGMRYGVSSFNHTLNSYTIYDKENFYGQNTIISEKEFNGLNASWIEVVGGLKAEVFNNIFVGFSVRLNYLVTNKKPDNFDNLYIPGFNKTYDGNFGAGFNYTLSYMIPIYKKNKEVEKI
jgi:hypothetical protein